MGGGRTGEKGAVFVRLTVSVFVVCVYLCLFVDVSAFVSVCSCVCLCVYMCVFVDVSTFVSVCSCVCLCVYMCVCMHMCIIC